MLSFNSCHSYNSIESDVQVMKGSCPQQQNGYDCGVYTILFALLIGRLINEVRDPIVMIANNGQMITNYLNTRITPRIVSEYRDECISDIRALAARN